MAATEAYAPCPCGSGEKYKFCCQKAEAYFDRVGRLMRSGQLEQALSEAQEGLKKFPDNPSLIVRAASALVQLNRSREARPSLEALVRKQPRNALARMLLIRVLLDEASPREVVDELQDALSVTEGIQADQAITVQLVASYLGRLGYLPAARKLLELVEDRLGPLRASQDQPSSLELLDGNARLTPWLRNPYRLAPPPAGLPEDQRTRFEEALEWARQGRWRDAAASFELLSAHGIVEADRNQGLCRLWLADHQGAVTCLLRAIAREGESTDAVDLEALCQIIQPEKPDDLVDLVHLIWNLRDRAGLLKRLESDPSVSHQGKTPIEGAPGAPPFEAEHFKLLDRPKLPAGTKDPKVEDLPHVLANVLVGQEIVILETYDDGRMDGLINRLAEIAGPTIPPAHPKTKEIDKVSRYAVVNRTESLPPEGLTEEEMDALESRLDVWQTRTRWPELPQAGLGSKTPREAASIPALRVPLRAALCLLEASLDDEARAAAQEVRTSLGVPPEPEIDPTTVDIEAVHIGRLYLVPADRLDDERLVALYRRARRFSLGRALEQAARALIGRPALLDRPEVGRVEVYGELGYQAARRGDKAAAYDWLDKGRASDPAARGANALSWDLLELRLKQVLEGPEVWVPIIAALFDRYQGTPESANQLLSAMIEMGLMEVVANPDDPERFYLDPRRLERLLAQYGPRITTATGTLGVSASRPGIWTPGAPTPGATTSPGGIIVPGGDPAGAPPRGKSGLILPS